MRVLTEALWPNSYTRSCLALLIVVVLSACTTVVKYQPLPERPLVNVIDARVGVYASVEVENHTFDFYPDIRMGGAIVEAFHQTAQSMFSETVSLPSTTEWRDQIPDVDGILELAFVYTPRSPVGAGLLTSRERLGLHVCLYDRDSSRVECWDPIVNYSDEDCFVLLVPAATNSCIVNTGIRGAMGSLLAQMNQSSTLRAWAGDTIARSTSP